MIFRKLGRYTSIIFLGCMVWPTPSHSAEIRCATVWWVQGLQDATPQKIEEMYQRRFPSGRRPIPGTSCVTGVLSGPIVQGDDERLVRFYRANHPFLDHFFYFTGGKRRCRNKHWASFQEVSD